MKNFKINIHKTTPIENQKPGTSGIRKKTKMFLEKNYLENYIQSVFNILITNPKQKFIIGSDGRYHNKAALNIILKIAIANNIQEIHIAKNNLISTPAISNYIRSQKMDFGIMLSASHNPGGINGDFGIKINNNHGAPIASSVAELIYKETQNISEFKSIENSDIEVDKLYTVTILNTTIKIVDPIILYSQMLEQIFDFDKIKNMFVNNNFNIVFDALNGATGPFAEYIFHHKLGVPLTSLKNTTPKEDFGGILPDPNPTTAKNLINEVHNNKNINLGFACDGDGDRHMICSKKYNFEPSDLLAIMLYNADKIPFYKNIKGVARSMPTSSAVDKVALSLGVNCFKVPTGWKFFGNLLDNNEITLCGEESFGIGSLHSREKDGIWSLLYILNIIAVTNKSLDALQEELWNKFGRVYFMRNDMENLDDTKANMIFNLCKKNAMPNQLFNDEFKISKAYDFEYKDITNNEITSNQGFVIEFTNQSRILVRKSGTGTEGVTLRFYLESFSKEDTYSNKSSYLKNLQKTMLDLIENKAHPTFIV